MYAKVKFDENNLIYICPAIHVKHFNLYEPQTIWSRKRFYIQYKPEHPDDPFPEGEHKGVVLQVALTKDVLQRSTGRDRIPNPKFVETVTEDSENGEEESQILEKSGKGKTNSKTSSKKKSNESQMLKNLQDQRKQKLLEKVLESTNEVPASSGTSSNTKNNSASKNKLLANKKVLQDITSAVTSAGKKKTKSISSLENNRKKPNSSNALGNCNVNKEPSILENEEDDRFERITATKVTNSEKGQNVLKSKYPVDNCDFESTKKVEPARESQGTVLNYNSSNNLMTPADVLDLTVNENDSTTKNYQSICSNENETTGNRTNCNSTSASLDKNSHSEWTEIGSYLIDRDVQPEDETMSGDPELITNETNDKIDTNHNIRTEIKELEQCLLKKIEDSTQLVLARMTKLELLVKVPHDTQYPQSDSAATVQTPVGYILDGKIHLGKDVWVNNNLYNFIQSTSRSASIFVGDLTEMIFSKEELINHSVTGQQCNANKATPAKPPLSPRRLSVISDTFRKWLRSKRNVTDKDFEEECKKSNFYIGRRQGYYRLKRKGDGDDGTKKAKKLKVDKVTKKKTTGMQSKTKTAEKKRGQSQPNEQENDSNEMTSENDNTGRKNSYNNENGSNNSEESEYTDD